MKQPALAQVTPRQQAIMIILALMVMLACWPPPTKAQPPPELANTRFWDDLPAMTRRGFIRVGAAFSPTYFYLADGKLRGFEYDLAQQYRQELNASLAAEGRKIEIVFVTLPRHKLIGALLEGQVDIIAAGLTVTPERQSMADFTSHYLAGVEEWVVSGPTARKLKTLDDLSGREVYVRRSSSYHAHLLDLNKRLAAKGRAPVKIVEADEGLSTEDILEMVNAGIVGITVVDSHLANLWAQALPDITVHRKLVIAGGGRLAWMVRPQNPLLKASLDQFMQAQRRAHKVTPAKFKRYCRPPQNLSNPLTPQRLRRFEHCRPYIDKYARKFGMDPLLVAAVAFVESGFNPEARSKHGAIGIMQLMPGSGGSGRLGAAQLRDPETNIQAGVKYLARIRDDCKADPRFSAEDDIYFALAAYNAGPRRLDDLHTQACRRVGRDPMDEELTAHQVIDDKAIRFVRRVNKIYAAYKLDDLRRQNGRDETKAR